ncbi:MAG: hypothetical protein WC356_04835 [Candidatus Micrarchaeia archaeon]
MMTRDDKAIVNLGELAAENIKQVEVLKAQLAVAQAYLAVAEEIKLRLAAAEDMIQGWLYSGFEIAEAEAFLAPHQAQEETVAVDSEKCPYCKGIGKINAWLHEGVERIGCPHCEGTGLKTILEPKK